MRARDALLGIGLLLAARTANADAVTDPVLAKGGTALKGVLAAPEKYRFQVLFSEVKKTGLERHGYREDAEYFFPASSMKVPVTYAAYDRLAGLRAAKPVMTRDATMQIMGTDPLSTTLARETLRALVVSDNESANRILAFGGHKEINQTLWSYGVASARLRGGFSTEAAIEDSPKILLGDQEIPARHSDLKLPANDSKNLAIGKAAYVNGALVQGPMSFADKNQIRIRDLQDVLIRILAPDLLPGRKDAISNDDRAYLIKTMGTLPSESGLAGYQRNVVSDYTLVPFLRGLERVKTRDKFQIHSKVGQAYGFLIGNARITDKETGRQFFLTAVVYANANEVMNADKYDYDTVSFPVLADVAEVFYRYVSENQVEGVTVQRAESHEVPGR